jgi:peptide/nickel transport system substrate-binding protein
MQAAQKKIADDYVNGYLFQLARTGVADAKLKGSGPIRRPRPMT